MATDIVEKLCLKCNIRVKTTGTIRCKHYLELKKDMDKACGYIGKPRSDKIVSIDRGIFDVSYHKEHVYCHKMVPKSTNKYNNK